MKKPIATILASSMFVGCTSLAPKYEIPKTENPAYFKEMTPEKREQLSAWKPAQPGQVNAAHWWTRFNDPILNELEEKVLTSNMLIAESVANYHQALALVRLARSAWSPTVGIAPSVTGGRTATTNSNTVTASSYTIPVEASWAPDLFGKVASAVDQSKAAAQVSEADLEGVKLTEEVALATAYFDLRAQDEMQRVYDDTVQSYQHAVDINTVLLRTGIGSQESLIQAQTQLLTAKAQATNLHIARAQYEHAIAMLVGQPASSFAVKEGPFNVVVPVTPVGLPSQILERRPDVAAAERNMAAANAEIGVARAAYFPSLSLTGSTGFGGIEAAPAFIWSLGAALTETIWDGGSRSALIDQYTATYQMQVAAYKQSVLVSFQQVEDQLAALHHLDIELHQQDDAVASSQSYVNIAQSRYKLGIDPYLTVVQAQITLLANQQTAINVRLQQLLASVQLIGAVGGDWDRSKLSNGDGKAQEKAKETPKADVKK